MFIQMQKESSPRMKIKKMLLCREAWFSPFKEKNTPLKKDISTTSGVISLISQIIQTYILPISIIAVMPYFHGSALISLLLILFCLAIFSSNKIFFLISALFAIGSSLIQTKLFSGGVRNIAQLQFNPGFVIPQYSGSAADYLIKCFGLTLPLAIIIFLILKDHFQKIFLVACFFPFMFAFLFQVTADMTANHKFIQITLILFCLFDAYFLQFLFFRFEKEKTIRHAYNPEKNPDRRLLSPFTRKYLSIVCKIITVILLFLFTITGIIEWRIYKNINRQTVTMKTDSKMTQWIEENTPEKSVFLTAPYSMNTFFLSGRFTYYGHSYYAASAGHNTGYRLEIYKDLLLGCENEYEKFINICKEENISYILIDDVFRIQEHPIDELFFQRELEIAAQFPEENHTVIYKIPI